MGIIDFFRNNMKNQPDAESDIRIYDSEYGNSSDFDDNRTVADIKPYFDSVIRQNFSDCEYRIDVPARELAPGCHPACTPIQYLFYKNGKPSLAVVLVQSNTYRGMNVKGTQSICELLGITYIRFFANCPNKTDYVVDRIRSYLK